MTCRECSPWAYPYALCPYGHLLREQAQRAHVMALAAPLDSPLWLVAAAAETHYSEHVGVPWRAPEAATTATGEEADNV